MNSIATASASTAQNVDRPAREQDRRADDFVVGLAAVSSPNFLNLLHQNMGPDSPESAECRSEQDASSGSKRSEGRQQSETKSQEHRAPAANGRRSEQTAETTRPTAADEKQSASEAPRPTAADEEPAAEVKDLLKNMQPVAKDESAVLAPLRPAASVINNGAGLVRLEGGWRPIAVQSAPQPIAVPTPDTAEVKGQVVSSLLRHTGLADGKGDIRLHLQPAHLGKVDIKLTRVGERLEIHIRVESAAAEQALREGADNLGHALLGKSATWSEVAIHIESTEPEEGEDPAESRDQDQEPQHGAADQEPDQGDEQEGER